MKEIALTLLIPSCHPTRFRRICNTAIPRLVTYLSISPAPRLSARHLADKLVSEYSISECIECQCLFDPCPATCCSFYFYLTVPYFTLPLLPAARPLMDKTRTFDSTSTLCRACGLPILEILEVGRPAWLRQWGVLLLLQAAGYFGQFDRTIFGMAVPQIQSHLAWPYGSSPSLC